MRFSMLTSVLVAVGLVTAAATAGAQSPANSTVVPGDAMAGLVACPDLPVPIPVSIQTITVRDANGAPMPNLPVRVTLSNSITQCATAVLGAMTDAAGVAKIVIAGGGCDPSISAASISANGVTLRRFVVKSPDWDGAAGDKIVNLPDLVAFMNADPCHDYDNNGAVNLSDLVVFSAAFAAVQNCP